MGRRTRRASFMPSVYVFPGGTLDPIDRRASGFPEAATPQVPGLDGDTRRRYGSFLHAALRETYEETGLLIGRPGPATPPAAEDPDIWRAYRQARVVPAFADLRPVARAITPRTSPKRFHSRFFLVDGRLAQGQIRDSDELEDVRWVPLEEFQSLPQTAEVTAAVLAEALRFHEATATSEALEVALFSWSGLGERARHRRRYGPA